MDDLLHYTLYVAIALRKIEGAELRRRLVVVGVGFELRDVHQVNDCVDGIGVINVR